MTRRRHDSNSDAWIAITAILIMTAAVYLLVRIAIGEGLP